MAITGYNTDIYPLDRIRGNLDGVVGTSDPAALRAHLVAIQTDLDIVMEKLPETTNTNGDVIAKNPVWIFPTEDTNFVRIQNAVDTMLASVDKISTVPKDSSAYHTGMLDLNDRAEALREDVMSATPYMYVSVANILFATIWIAAIIGIFSALKRKKEQLKEADDVGI